MSHEPALLSHENTLWFECSCGWMGDESPFLFGASNRWLIHMADVANAQVRVIAGKWAEQ